MRSIRRWKTRCAETCRQKRKIQTDRAGNERMKRMITLKGAEVSAKIKEQTAEMLKQCGGRIPKLAIVRVG